jgi:hypothetical protein
LLNKLLHEGDYRFDRDEAPPTGQSRIKAWFEIDGKKAILTAKVNTYTDGKNKDIVVSSDQQWYLKDFTGSAKRIVAPLWMLREVVQGGELRRSMKWYSNARMFEYHNIFEINDAARKPLIKIIRFLKDMKYYSASQFTNPSNCPVSFEIEKEGKYSRGLRLQGHTRFLNDLFTQYRAKDSSGFQDFFDIIGPDGIGLIDKISFQEILTSSIEHTVRSGGKVEQRNRDKVLVIPQFRIGRHELSPNQLSEGTFKTITLLFYLITETSSLLLVEEPEVCVHHGLLSSIIELIKIYSNEKQIIVSTHSDFVLDKVSPEDVYKVLGSLENGTTVSHIPKSMLRKELSALKDYLESEGNLGEYWRHGGLE